MLPKQGKEEVTKLMAKLAVFAVKDVSKYIPQFKDAAWLFAMAAQHPRVEPLPSAAGQVRVQCMGATRFVVAEASSFLGAMQQLRSDDPCLGLDKACKLLHDMEQATLARYIEKGALFYSMTLLASEALWIPAGFLCATRGEQSALLYGVRKSFYNAGSTTKASLEAIHKMMLADKRAPARLLDVINLYPA